MPQGRKRSYARSFMRTVKRRRRTRATKRTPFRKRRPRGFKKPMTTFPKKQLVELTYADDIVIPNKAAGSAPYKFRMNSIADPDFTGVGHQPRGHDQFAGIYQKYCVIGAKARIELLYSGDQSTESTVFGYVDDDDTSDGYSVNELIELGMPKTTHQFVVIGGGTNNHAIGGRRYRNLNFKVGMKKFFGIGKNDNVINAQALGAGESTAPSDLAAAFGSNPVKQAFLKLHVDGPSHDGHVGGIKARITIKYMCVLFDPREVSSS